MMELDVEVASS